MADGGTKVELALDSSDGIRRTEEAGAEKRKREREREEKGAVVAGELTNAKEPGGISHLISRATRLRDLVGSRASARKGERDKARRER